MRHRAALVKALLDRLWLDSESLVLVGRMSLFHRTKRAFSIFFASRGRYFLLRQVKPPMPLVVRGKQFELTGPANEGFKNTYSEVIAEDAYQLRKRGVFNNPALIVDIGANIGLFSCYAAALFPNAKVHAYEPNPEALEYLRENAKLFSNIEVHPQAISCKYKKASLVQAGDTTTGSIGKPTSEASSISCLNPQEIAPGQQIDFLKIDCEGSEFDIFEDSGLLSRTRKSAMEFHLDPQNTMQMLKSLISNGGHKITSSHPDDTNGCSFGYLYTERNS